MNINNMKSMKDLLLEHEEIESEIHTRLERMRDKFEEMLGYKLEKM